MKAFLLKYRSSLLLFAVMFLFGGASKKFRSSTYKQAENELFL